MLHILKIIHNLKVLLALFNNIYSTVTWIPRSHVLSNFFPNDSECRALLWKIFLKCCKRYTLTPTLHRFKDLPIIDRSSRLMVRRGRPGDSYSLVPHILRLLYPFLSNLFQASASMLDVMVLTPRISALGRSGWLRPACATKWDPVSKVNQNERKGKQREKDGERK